MRRFRSLTLGLALTLALPQVAFADGPRTVTVARGESLSRIATRELGSPERWTDLCTLNRALLGNNCDVIEIGMVLRLPEGTMDQTRPPIDSRDPSNADAAETGLDAAEPFPPRDDALADPSDTAPDLPPPPIPVVLPLIGPEDVFEIPLTFLQTEGYTSSPNGPHGGVSLSGHVPDDAATDLPGIPLRLPEEVEKRASGRSIEIAVTLISAVPTTADIAYSTAEMGDSGWISMTATPQGARSAFVYAVPELRLGHGDFVGLRPDPNNRGQSVEVTEITITILPEG